MLFTDIEGSTRLLHELGEGAYREALAEHRRVVREACGRHGGYEVDYEGDSFFYAFASATGAVRAAEEVMCALESGPVRLRVGIHTGEPGLDPPKYVGVDVHLAARVMAAGHGGQVLMTRSTGALLNVDLKDLGEHRLKDFTEPVALFQLGIQGFPPLKTISNTNLPRPASSFVGRSAEVADISSLLRNGSRLVTLTGPGGSGKTRLAIEVAAELVEEFKAGVFWIGLASLLDPELVLQTIAQTLGAKEELSAHISEREVLLLLDNLEQVIDAAPQLAALAEACPNLRLLITSRHLLRVRGEIEYEVLPLADSEAVDLFCARARVDPSVLVEELCRRLDNLPLALELAAARTSVLMPSQILERLAQRIDLLRGGRDADPRQATLRATIEWSYDLLDEHEKCLFRRLAVFAGGCTLEAVEEVAGADLDTLQSLVEKSLVRFTAARYWMLETIREYAESRLVQPGEGHDVALRHAHYFLAYAREAEGSPQHFDPAAYPRLAADLQNLRVALATLQREREGEFRELAGSLREFFEYQGLIREGERWLRLALSVSPVVDETAAKLRLGLTKLARWSGDWAESAAEADAAVSAARQAGNSFVLAEALRDGAAVALNSGDYATAHVLLDEAVALLESTQADAVLAGVLVNLADLALNEQRWSDATALAERGIEVGRKANPVSEAISHLNRGVALLELDEAGRAAESLATGIQMANDLGMTLFVALSLSRLAEAIADTEPVRATRLLGASDALLKELGVVNNPIEIEATARISVRLKKLLTSNGFDEYKDEGSKLDQDAAVALALTASPGP